MPLRGDHSLTWTDRIAIPGLIRYVALLNALVFLLHLLSPGYLSVLELDPRLVLHGEVWRLVTWIFIPETLSPIWILFSLLFLFYIGDGLEQALGPGRLTLFYLRGVLLCTGVSFLLCLTTDTPALGRANTFLNLSLLVAFATAFPDFKVLVFFLIPVRMAWLAVASVVLMILSSIGQPPVVAATLAAALLNYAIDFAPRLTNLIRRHPQQIPGRSTRPEDSSQPLHRCEACGITEISRPEAEFRVHSSGDEYCLEHLPVRSTN